MMYLANSSLPPPPYAGDNPEDFIGDDIPQVAKIFFIVLGIFLMISGTLGNLLVFITLYKCPSLHSLHFVYVVNLAIADFVIEAYSSPFVMYDLILGHHPVINQTHCMFNGFLVVMCYVSSLFTLASISFNRYMHVCQNAIYNRYVTRKLTLSMLVLVWVISAAVAAAPLFGWGHYGYDAKTHYCGYNRTASISYTILIAVGTIAIPATAVCFFNYSIFSYVSEARKTLSKWRQEAGPVDIPCCGDIAPVQASVEYHVQDPLGDNKDKDPKNLDRTPRQLPFNTHALPCNHSHSTSEISQKCCQTKDKNFGFERRRKSATRHGAGAHVSLSPQLSFSAPNLQYQIEIERCENHNLPSVAKSDSGAGARHLIFVRGRSVDQAGLENDSHRQEIHHLQLCSDLTKRQSVPDTVEISKPLTLFAPYRKRQQSRGALRASKPNELLKPSNKNLQVPSIQTFTQNGSKVSTPDSTRGSSSQTLQIFLKEISSEVTSSTAETSHSTDSERPGRRRHERIRSASRGPGSLKIKRQQDSRSRSTLYALSSTQKAPSSFTAGTHLGKMFVTQKLACFAHCCCCCVPQKVYSTENKFLEQEDSVPPQQVQEMTPSAVCRRQQRQQQPLGINNLDLIRTLFVVFVCMAVFMSPYMVTTIADVHDKWPAVIHCACSYLAVVNNAINWMLYGMLNPSFRAGYRHVMFSLFYRRSVNLQTQI